MWLTRFQARSSVRTKTKLGRDPEGVEPGDEAGELDHLLAGDDGVPAGRGEPGSRQRDRGQLPDSYSAHGYEPYGSSLVMSRYSPEACAGVSVRAQPGFLVFRCDGRQADLAPPLAGQAGQVVELEGQLHGQPQVAAGPDRRRAGGGWCAAGRPVCWRERRAAGRSGWRCSRLARDPGRSAMTSSRAWSPVGAGACPGVLDEASAGR